MELRRQIRKRVSLNRIEKLEFCQATPLLTEWNDEVGGLTGVPGFGPSLRTNSPQLGGMDVSGLLRTFSPDFRWAPRCCQPLVQPVAILGGDPTISLAKGFYI